MGPQCYAVVTTSFPVGRVHMKRRSKARARALTMLVSVSHGASVLFCRQRAQKKRSLRPLIGRARSSFPDALSGAAANPEAAVLFVGLSACDADVDWLCRCRRSRLCAATLAILVSQIYSETDEVVGGMPRLTLLWGHSYVAVSENSPLWNKQLG